MITCDSFAAVRRLIARPRSGRRQARRHVESSPGRWSLFPGNLAPPSRSDVVQHWCRQLLKRWGVVFRDLLARETSAPPWHELVRAFRSMEYRGEIRGGRFVHGVAGEQFAQSNAIDALRQLRNENTDDPWTVISAADPSNLVGILDATSERIPATTRNALIYVNGHCSARQVSGVIQFSGELSPVEKSDWTRALARGMRPRADAGRP
jgi:ATP-dependent Lhr-like helicase